MATSTYNRLTWSRPRRKGFFGVLAARQSLWVGDDHLLSIDATNYTEEYKRFYFRDIQAFFIVPTARRAIWNGILAAFLVMNLLVFGGLGASSTALLIVGLILAIPLVINNVFGPACRVYLRTAVQVEGLPSLSRIRRTQKILARLRPRISAVQGSLTAEEAATRWRQETAQ